MDGLAENPSEGDPRREIIDSGHVEIEEVSPGLNMTVNAESDGENTFYTTRIEATPNLPGSRKSYQDEGEAAYNQNGDLIGLTTHVFWGHDYAEELLAMADRLDWSQMSAILAASNQSRLVSEMLGTEAGASIMRQLAEASIAYALQTEEPHVGFTKGRFGSWDVKLLPSPEELGGEGRIRNTHNLGSVRPSSDERVSVRWGDNILKYGVRESKKHGIDVLSFVTSLEQTVMTKQGFVPLVFEREIYVPKKVSGEGLDGLFELPDTRYLSIRSWFPVGVKRPQISGTGQNKPFS